MIAKKQGFVKGQQVELLQFPAGFDGMLLRLLAKAEQEAREVTGIETFMVGRYSDTTREQR